MTKIAYNGCYGGFSLSQAAIDKGRELSGDPEWGNRFGRDMDRSDNILIKVIEELGNRADGSFARLLIKDIPKGTKYRIDEYDGIEDVMTIDDYEWSIA